MLQRKPLTSRQAVAAARPGWTWDGGHKGALTASHAFLPLSVPVAVSLAMRRCHGTFRIG